MLYRLTGNKTAMVLPSTGPCMLLFSQAWLSHQCNHDTTFMTQLLSDWVWCLLHSREFHVLCCNLAQKPGTVGESLLLLLLPNQNVVKFPSTYLPSTQRHGLSWSEKLFAQGSSQHRDSKWVRVLKLRDWVLPPKWDIFIPIPLLPPQAQKTAQRT